MISKLNKKTLILFISMLIFKISLEYGYWTLLQAEYVTYTFDFNGIKYLNGILWCAVLFLNIRHEKKKASTFFLYLIFILQIIPITVIYALGNDNALYYNVLCGCFLLCEVIVNLTLPGKEKRLFEKKKTNMISLKARKEWLFEKLSLLMYGGFIVATIGLFVVVLKNNGLPSLMALNIYNVYLLREAKSFVIGKYMYYILIWVINVILPLYITQQLLNRKYVNAMIGCGFVFVLYLYTGFKTYLFSIPLIIICVAWSQRENHYYEIFSTACIAFSILSFTATKNRILSEVFSLLGRRVMLVSANNKFKYFDFFSKNEKMGMAGNFPRWLINIENPYEEGIGYIISREYYNKPEMNSNTGFFAEGYMRYGWIGMILSFVLLALLIRLMDNFSKRNGYRFCIGTCVYMVFMLSDSYLIGSLMFGAWMLLVVVLIVYDNNAIQKVKELLSNKMRR